MARGNLASDILLFRLRYESQIRNRPESESAFHIFLTKLRKSILQLSVRGLGLGNRDSAIWGKPEFALSVGINTSASSIFQILWNI